MPRWKCGKVLECLPAVAPSGLACGFVGASGFGLPGTSGASVNWTIQQKAIEMVGAGALVLWREAEGRRLVQVGEGIRTKVCQDE